MFASHNFTKNVLDALFPNMGMGRSGYRDLGGQARRTPDRPHITLTFFAQFDHIGRLFLYKTPFLAHN